MQYKLIRTRFAFRFFLISILKSFLCVCWNFWTVILFGCSAFFNGLTQKIWMICKTFAGEKKKDNNNNYNNKTHGPFIKVYALKPVKHDTSVKILLQNPWSGIQWWKRLWFGKHSYKTWCPGRYSAIGTIISTVRFNLIYKMYSMLKMWTNEGNVVGFLFILYK